ncbi:MAG TPA: hypothetical protein ENF45_01245 [Bacteroidetes bacterium]|nr:hypothetical protein [Bacteroidota bacterium]
MRKKCVAKKKNAKAKSTKRTKPKSSRKKSNPLLIRVNPSDDQENLWIKAKSLKPDLTRKEFDRAIKQFYNQHHCLPDKLTLEDVPGIAPDVKVLIKVGNVDQIHYSPDQYSRKAPYRYFHKTKRESLLTDADGKILILNGKTKISNRGFTKGWLVQ